jgi:gamma-glutamylcyclotransferase
MSLQRLRERLPGAEHLESHTLIFHDLRFHKIGQDGSGKCDALFTRNPDEVIMGVLYEISSSDKRTLDKIEGWDLDTVIRKPHFLTHEAIRQLRPV